PDVPAARGAGPAAAARLRGGGAAARLRRALGEPAPGQRPEAADGVRQLLRLPTMRLTTILGAAHRAVDNTPTIPPAGGTDSGGSGPARVCEAGVAGATVMAPHPLTPLLGRQV